jgi:hypothetical protein
MQTHKCEQCSRNEYICIFSSLSNKHLECFKQACKYVDANRICAYATFCDGALNTKNMKCLRFAILAGASTKHCFRALVIKTNLRLACLRIKKRHA